MGQKLSGSNSWRCILLALWGANKSPLCRPGALPPAEACLLTFDMGEEVVSEGGVGTGVAVGGAEAAGAQGGPPVHTRRQKLCAAAGNQPMGQGEVETEKKEEINTGAGQAPKVGEGMKSVNQKSGKRSKDRQRVRNAPVEG